MGLALMVAFIVSSVYASVSTDEFVFEPGKAVGKTISIFILSFSVVALPIWYFQPQIQEAISSENCVEFKGRGNDC